MHRVHFREAGIPELHFTWVPQYLLINKPYLEERKKANTVTVFPARVLPRGRGKTKCVSEPQALGIHNSGCGVLWRGRAGARERGASPVESGVPFPAAAARFSHWRPLAFRDQGLRRRRRCPMNWGELCLRPPGPEPVLTASTRRRDLPKQKSRHLRLRSAPPDALRRWFPG